MASIAPDDPTRLLESSLTRAFSIHVPETVWIVESGRLDLFVIPVAKGEVGGARRHFVSIEAGHAVFGMNSITDHEFGILAALVPGTKLRCIRLDCFRAQEWLVSSGTDRAALLLLEEWICTLTKASAKALLPKEARELCTDKILETTEESKPIVSGQGILWVQHSRGSSRYLNDPAISPVPEGDFFPLALQGWLQLEPFSQIRALCSEEWAKIDPEWQSVQTFHRIVLEWLNIDRRSLAELERQRLLLQGESDSAAFRGALQSLTTPLLDPDAHRVSPGEGAPLMQVCNAVGKALGTKMVCPAELHHGRALQDPIAAIAKASSLRSRVVALKGKWWRDASGPLVAFREKGNSPVALLPGKHRGYELFDPESSQKTTVSPAVALTLNGFAHAFYRPLPDEKLSPSTILANSLRDSKRELCAILFMGMVSGLLSLVVPVATGILFNTIIPGAQKNELLLMGLFLLISTVAGAMFSLTRSLATLVPTCRRHCGIECYACQPRFSGGFPLATSQTAVWPSNKSYAC